MPQQLLIISPEKQRLAPPYSQPTAARSSRGRLASPVLQLQRTLGNRRVAELIQARCLTSEGRIIGSRTIGGGTCCVQPKLTVGAADDQYEQEADRVARQVMSMPDAARPTPGSIQRAGLPEESPEEDKDKPLQPSPLGSLGAAISSVAQQARQPQRQPEEEEPEKEAALQRRSLANAAHTANAASGMQRQAEMDEDEAEPTRNVQAKPAASLAESFEAGEEVETRLNRSEGGGSPLPEAVRSFMEPRFGMDFSHVSIHTGSEAIQANRDIGAKAFTHGSDIYYGAGQSPGDLELTAHELTHVVQQTGPVRLQSTRQDGAFSASTHPSLQRACAACSASTREEGFADPDSSREIKLLALAPAATTFLQSKCATCEQEERLQRKKSGTVQRKSSISPPANGELQDDEDTIDRKLADSVENPLGSSKGSGVPLPENFRAGMESAFDADFSAVKVHTNENAVQMNRDLGAKAFTHGNDIYFNDNSYNPYTSSGKTLLAHELTHVVQQSGSGFQQEARSGSGRGNINQVTKTDIVQLAPNVTALNGPAEMPAGQGSRVTLTATAARGTAISWNFVGANNGAVLGAGTGRTNTLTAPAGSTGGVITVQAADATNAADVSPPLNITLVEIQQPTFAFAPAMPAFAPPNTMDVSVCGNNATAAAITAPAGRPVTWSIVGSRLGATIDPATGVIVPSATKTGNIRIRAADNVLPVARNEQTLAIQAHPTGIRNTAISAFPLGYGATYTHTFGSSGGSLANVFVTERIFCGNDPFGFCPRAAVPILPGTINAQVNAASQMNDNIRTNAANPGIDVNNFLPSPPNPGLPQTLTTPQILSWRSDQCSPAPAAAAATAADFWVPFENVAMQAILFTRGSGANPFFFRTIVNGVRTDPEAYTGPALAPAAAPAASVCGAGEGLSNINFNPSLIAADSSALTTTSATVRARPGGNLVTWSFPGPTSGANIVAQGNPALLSAGNIAGRVRVRAAITANPGCFTEGWLRMQEVEIGPDIKFRPDTVRAGATTRATVSTKPGSRIVTWAILPPDLGAVIAGNPDNSATITAGAQVGRITIRATDQRDATKFAEASLVIG